MFRLWQKEKLLPSINNRIQYLLQLVPDKHLKAPNLDRKLHLLKGNELQTLLLDKKTIGFPSLSRTLNFLIKAIPRTPRTTAVPIIPYM